MAKITRHQSVLTLVLFALSLIGCASPLHIIKQAEPNPFDAGAEPHFVLLPFDWSDLEVDSVPEAVWLEKLDADQRESYATDKKESEEKFAEALLEGATDARVRVVTKDDGSGHRLRITAERFRPGWYGFLVAEPAELSLLVHIDDPEGNEVDVIRLNEQFAGYSSGQKMRAACTLFGSALADYLAERVHPKP